MRMLAIAIMAVSAAGVATLVTSAPAAAYDYPWCAQGRGVGYPGDCSYSNRGQCLASASGRDLDCNINPRVAFAQRGRPPAYYAPYPAYPRHPAYPPYREY